MYTISDLIEAFVSIPLAINVDASSLRSNSGFALEGAELIEDRPHQDRRTVAAWEIRDEITDHRCWIRNDFTGYVRSRIEEQLARELYLPLTFVPVDAGEMPGASVTWFALPRECMACGDCLDATRRRHGLCLECQQLRDGDGPSAAAWEAAWRQSDGLHGALLPPRGHNTRGRD